MLLFTLWWYFKPFPWLGFIMAVIAGGFSYLILSTKRMERFRRVFYIGLFVLALTGLITIITTMGWDTFSEWASTHQKSYYLPGQSIGILSYPCTREVPQVLLGRAAFLPGLGVWQTTFPSSLNDFLLLMVPYVLTGFILVGASVVGFVLLVG